MLKTLFHALIFIVFLSIGSCKNKPAAPANNPAALAEKGSFGSGLFKSYRGNLVDELYTELLDKSRELSAVEDSLRRLETTEKDSLSRFANYDNKITHYYENARGYARSVTDSTLKARIGRMIDYSDSSYKAMAATQLALMEGIDKNKLTLSDLHSILMIVKTLPVIEKYQKANLPKGASLQKYANKQARIIQQMDTLIRE